jgi:hypothetical protein
MRYEVVEDRDHPGDWRVEAIDHDSEGECHVAIFAGKDAERRAQEYADWKEWHVWSDDRLGHVLRLVMSWIAHDRERLGASEADRRIDLLRAVAHHEGSPADG